MLGELQRERSVCRGCRGHLTRDGVIMAIRGRQAHAPAMWTGVLRANSSAPSCREEAAGQRRGSGGLGSWIPLWLELDCHASMAIAVYQGTREELEEQPVPSCDNESRASTVPKPMISQLNEKDD